MAAMLKFAGPDIDDETIAGVADVLRSGHIASGPWVQRFEADLSVFCGGRPVRVVTSATAAMEVALQLAGVGHGDEVILAAQSFFASMNMVVKVGATPVFVDCDLVTRNIDVAVVEAAITPRTKAILPTHWPGTLADMDALHALAKRRRLRVIEDAALVIGSQWHGRNIGAIGDLVTFSFHPNKNMTSIEGGALVVNDAAEAERVDELRFHGILRLRGRHARRALSRRQVQSARRQRADRRCAACAAAAVSRDEAGAGRTLLRALRVRAGVRAAAAPARA